MVLPNRPWRLVRDLAKVLVATLASAGFFIVNANAWGIADQLALPGLLLGMVLAVGGLASGSSSPTRSGTPPRRGFASTPWRGRISTDRRSGRP